MALDRLMGLVGTESGKMGQAVGDFAKKGPASDWSLFIIAALLLFLAAAIQHSSGQVTSFLSRYMVLTLLIYGFWNTAAEKHGKSSPSDRSPDSSEFFTEPRAAAAEEEGLRT